MGEMKSAYRSLVGKPEMILRETGWEDVDLIYLAQYRDQWQVL
jgi:hypothetical protein